MKKQILGVAAILCIVVLWVIAVAPAINKAWDGITHEVDLINKALEKAGK